MEAKSWTQGSGRARTRRVAPDALAAPVHRSQSPAEQRGADLARLVRAGFVGVAVVDVDYQTAEGRTFYHCARRLDFR